MENTLSTFLQHLTDERRFAANTVAAYGNDLRQLAEFIRGEAKRNGQEAQWAAVERPLLLGYLVNLREKRYSPSTTARKVAAIRALFNYLASQGQMERNPALELASPRVEKPQPQVIGIAEIESLLREVAAKAGPEARRDSAMIELLFNTGLRVTELISLDVVNLNLEKGQLRYRSQRGRSSRERTFPLVPPLVQRLKDYLRESRPQLNPNSQEAALFLNRRGQRLTRQGFWLILKGYAKQAKLGAEITPHTLRHSSAVHLLHSGRMSLRELQEFLGHANISTTQVYATVTPGSSRHPKGRSR